MLEFDWLGDKLVTTPDLLPKILEIMKDDKIKNKYTRLVYYSIDKEAFE